MFKFLRKYNKLILAVGGTMLMIVFLIPQAIQSISQQRASTRATVATVGDGENVSSEAWQQVQNEVLFMRRTGLVIRDLGGALEPEHWFLLVREAEQMGMIGNSPLSQMTPEQLSITAQIGGVNYAFAEQALSRFIGVESMLQLYQGAGKLSDRRLKKEAERLLHNVQATLVVIEAKTDKVEATYTESQVQAQFDQYKDVLPGEGDMPFGYKLPDRVKIEWIAIPASSVRDMVNQDSEAINGITLRRHWREYANTAGLPPVNGTGEIPALVREHLIDQVTQERLNDIAKSASDMLQNRRRGLPLSAGYIVIPDDWIQKQLAFPELAEQLQENFGIDLPAYHATGDQWRTTVEMSDLDSIGQATTDKYGSLLRLAQIVSEVKEFGDSITVYVQEDIAGPPLRGADGSIYLFRLTETDPTREAHSLDEVRDQVVMDLKRQTDFERLKQELVTIESKAQTGGLLDVAMSYDTIVQFKSSISMNNPFAFGPVPLPVIGASEESKERIIEFSLTLPRDQKAEDLPLAQRSFAFPVEDKLAIVVARIDQQRPLTVPDYQLWASTNRIQGMIRFDELNEGESIKAAFGLDELVARHNFAFTATSSDDAEADDDAGLAENQTASADDS
ncbi:MAG: hypothetical protein O7G85_15835 [Planctomycetota bacterium]|nr:hypothetical protein [Planctomycetota bacterium]